MPLDLNFYPRFGETPDTPIMSMDIRSFRGGMVNKVHPANLELDQAVLLQNVLLKQGALAEKRSGATDKMDALTPPTGNVNGMGYWNPPAASSTARLIASTASGVYDWGGSGDWRGLTGGAFSGQNPVTFVQGHQVTPDFQPLGWFFQKGASQVLEYDGGGILRSVSGGQNGLINSVPTGVCALFWLGRLWVAEDGDRNGYVSFSEFGEPRRFDLSQGFYVNPNDEVTKIVQWFNAGIVIFQRNTIWALDIDQGNFTGFLFDSTRMEMLNEDIGCVAPKSVAQSGQDFFFLSRFGVMRLSRTARDRAVGRAIPISDPIEETIRRINWSAADVATGISWDNLYLLAVPVDGSVTNNLVLVWDIREEAWSTITGWNTGDWQIARFPNGEDKLYFGTSNTAGAGEVYEAFDPLAEDDDTTDIEGVVQTPRYDMGTTDQKKTMRYIDVFTDASSGGSVEVYAAPDNQDFTLLETLDVSAGQLTLPFFLPPVGDPVLGGALLQRNRVYLDRFEGVREIQFQFKMIGNSTTKLLYFTVDGQPDEVNWG